MEAVAVTRYLRISPRKLRLVTRAITRKPVAEAFATLKALDKKGARLVEKTLKSAHANAKVKKMDESKLYVRKVFADDGPTFKRFMSRSMGRADLMLKRTSHLSIVLAEREIPFNSRRTGIPKEAAEETTKGSKGKKKKQLAGAAS